MRNFLCKFRGYNWQVITIFTCSSREDGKVKSFKIGVSNKALRKFRHWQILTQESHEPQQLCLRGVQKLLEQNLTLFRGSPRGIKEHKLQLCRVQRLSNRLAVVVLAAGKGTRMKSTLQIKVELVDPFVQVVAHHSRSKFGFWIFQKHPGQ